MSSLESKERRDAYSPEKAEAIVTALGRGVPFKWACETLGITEQTGHNWRKAHPEFNERVRATRAGKVGDYYSQIVRAAEEGDVKAAKWLVDKAESQYHDDAQRPDEATTSVDNVVDIDRKAIASVGFAEFCRRAWAEIDSASLVWSWHLDEICGELEAAVRARLERNEAADLAIATPPGSGKSRPISVLLQPWAWTLWPWSAWITSAYDDDLAARFSRLSKNLVRSPWYQARWPLRVTKDSDHFWENAEGGKRIAVGIGSRITGEHAHVIIGDDLVKEQLARIGTPAAIAQAVGKSTDYWFGTLSTRAIDHKAARILVQQRLHRDDPVGVATAKHGYRSIVFRARYDEAHPDPSNYHTHKREPGELLCSRLTEEAMAKVEFELGPTAARAQLQQEPVPPGGQFLKAEYMAHRWDALPPELMADVESRRQGPGRAWVIGGDMTFKSKRQARGRRTPDYTVFELWCAFEGRRYLCDEVRGIWGFREAKAQLAAFALRHPQASKILLEDAANAPACEDDLAGNLTEDQDLIAALLALEPGEQKAPLDWASCIVLEPVGGGCLARTQAVEGIWASGAVVLPAGQPWVDGPGGFVEEHTRFVGDGTDTDDRVSVSSLVLLHFKATTATPAWVRAAQAQMARQQTGRR